MEFELPKAPKDTMVVRFYDHPKLDKQKSMEKGHRVYTSTPYISFKPTRASGLERCDEYSRPMRESDRDQYPEQWHRYLNNKQEGKEGHALNLLPACNPALELELSQMGIDSIEALAREEEAPNCENVALLWRQAKAYINFLEAEQ